MKDPPDSHEQPHTESAGHSDAVCPNLTLTREKIVTGKRINYVLNSPGWS